MPLQLRRIIYLSFIALFLSVAPLLALYSMGYRYHWEKHRFERTGLITVDGEPRDATIRIDGVVRARRLPARIGGLGENEYVLRVERDDFHPWEQRLTVMSGRTTIVRDVLLFRDATPTMAIPGSIATFAVSADGRWAAFVRTGAQFAELWFRHLGSGAHTLALRVVMPAPATGEGSGRGISAMAPAVGGALAAPVQLSWSPRQAILLVTTASDVLAVNPERLHAPLSIGRLLLQRPSSVQWELGSANALTAVVEGRLIRVHLATGRTVALALHAPDGPFAVARGIAYAARADRVLGIPTNGGPASEIATIPNRATITAFTDVRGTTLSAETRNPDQLLTISTTDGNVRTQVGYGLRRTPDGDAVLWHANPFELWGSSGDPPAAQLLARRDVPFVAAAWHPNERYVLLATGRDVAAVAAGPARRQPIPLATFEAIRAIAVGPDGATLTIIGRRRTAEGLWSLPLR